MATDGDDRNEPARNLIGKPLVTSLGFTCQANQLQNAGKRSFSGGLARRLSRDIAVEVERASQDAITGLLENRPALAGEHLLIDEALLADKIAIGWKPLARQHAEKVAEPDLFQRDRLLDARS